MKLLLLWEIVIVMINWNDYRPNWTPLSPVTIIVTSNRAPTEFVSRTVNGVAMLIWSILSCHLTKSSKSSIHHH